MTWFLCPDSPWIPFSYLFSTVFLSFLLFLPFFSPSFFATVFFMVLLLILKKISNLGIPGGSDSKESACNAGDPGSISGSGRSPGDGNGCPFQYSCLKKFHGQRSLAGYSPWGHKNTTEWLTLSLFTFSNIKKKKLQEQYKLLDPLHTNYLNENILLYFSHLWRDIFLLTWCLSPLIHVCIPKIRTLLLSITTIQTLPVKNSTLIWYSLIHRPDQISPVVLTKPPFPSQSRILSTNMYSTSLSSLISFLQSGTIPPEQFFVSQVLQSFSFRPFILKGDSTFNAAPWPKTMHSWQE